MLRCTGHEEGDDDLGRDVELEGIREEDADGIEQLNWLVQPAERAETRSEPALYAHTPAMRVQNSPKVIWPYLSKLQAHVSFGQNISRLGIYLVDILTHAHIHLHKK